MKNNLDSNQISARDITISAAGLVPARAVLKKVRLSYASNEKGQRSNTVESIRYDCVDPSTFSCFTLKVPSSTPVITEEELEEAETSVFISIPVDQVVIRPYKLEYGYATVSIVAPYVELSTSKS